jgi:NADH:ubiquinone oxidoreductase subunit 3 (subunit A)
VVTYPVVAVLRQWAGWGKGAIAFIEILLFILILVTGLIFLWRKGDLEWIKKL